MNVIHVDETNFEQEVLQSNLPVLVDIWAPWCGPCKMLGPVVEEVAMESDQIKVAKLDADKAPELAQKYKVASIPTLLVFKDGKEVNRSVGLISKEAILDLMKG